MVNVSRVATPSRLIMNYELAPIFDELLSYPLNVTWPRVFVEEHPPIDGLDLTVFDALELAAPNPI